MKAPSILLAITFGAALGAGFVIACSDDAPGNADAATCDCPASEPPLAGRLTTVRITGNIEANGTGSAGAGCPAGSTIIGGGCNVEGNGSSLIVLTRAGFNRTVPAQPGYSCGWTSTAPANAVGVAEAVCLMPAP